MATTNEGPRWEPGTLPTREIERILVDALADLWRDEYRRGEPLAQRRNFRRKVESSIYSATGHELWLTTNRERR